MWRKRSGDRGGDGCTTGTHFVPSDWTLRNDESGSCFCCFCYYNKSSLENSHRQSTHEVVNCTDRLPVPIGDLNGGHLQGRAEAEQKRGAQGALGFPSQSCCKQHFKIISSTYFIYLFLICFGLFDRVLWCGSGWLYSHHVAQAALETAARPRLQPPGCGTASGLYLHVLCSRLYMSVTSR